MALIPRWPVIPDAEIVFAAGFLRFERAGKFNLPCRLLMLSTESKGVLSKVYRSNLSDYG